MRHAACRAAASEQVASALHCKPMQVAPDPPTVNSTSLKKTTLYVVISPPAYPGFSGASFVLCMQPARRLQPPHQARVSAGSPSFVSTLCLYQPSTASLARRPLRVAAWRSM